MATSSLSVRKILFAATLMVITIDPTFCFERFGWMVGESCDSIPYPFGTHGKALQGFELNCHSGEAYLLAGNNQSYPIQIIDANTVSIGVGSIYVRCYNDNGSEIIEDDSGLLNFVGTPYTISTTVNVLVTVGCNDLVKIINADYPLGEQINSCVNFCGSPEDIVQNSYCLGLGCCTAALPGYGMQNFHLEFSNMEGSNNSRFSNCSVSYIVNDISTTYISFSLSTEISKGSYLNSERKYYPYIQTLTLDWAIGEQTCEEAMNQSKSYHCKNHSDCYNQVGGYLCNCSTGFQGNPYVLSGCTDTYTIDTCAKRKA